MSEQLPGELLAAGPRLAKVQQHFADLCGLKRWRSADCHQPGTSSARADVKSCVGSVWRCGVRSRGSVGPGSRGRSRHRSTLTRCTNSSAASESTSTSHVRSTCSLTDHHCTLSARTCSWALTYLGPLCTLVCQLLGVREDGRDSSPAAGAHLARRSRPGGLHGKLEPTKLATAHVPC
jgi:hypothetical protein